MLRDEVHEGLGQANAAIMVTIRLRKHERCLVSKGFAEQASRQPAKSQSYEYLAAPLNLV